MSSRTRAAAGMSAAAARSVEWAFRHQEREAIDRGREISRNAGTEFKIHNRDGRIAQSDSHGNDPRNIKG